jgi:hypothetical protein
MGLRRTGALITATCLAAVLPGVASSAVAGRGFDSVTAFGSGKAVATEHISLTSAGGQFPGIVLDFSPMDRSARFVAFTAKVKRRVGGGSDHLVRNVFIRDRTLNMTRLVSVGRGHPANGDSDGPAISSDGHYVAFMSEASNLVRGDTNGSPDVFVRNLRTDTTRRVSVPAAGVGERNANADSFGPLLLSAHAGLVVFTSAATNLVRHDTNRKTDVFVRDRRRGVTRRLSVGPHGRETNGDSQGVDLSADGRQVVFLSDATNLGPRDVNGHSDVYARRIRRPGNELVSRRTGGGQFSNCGSGAISARGRFVTFECGMADVTGAYEAVFRRDLLRGVTVPVSTDANGHVARGGVAGVDISNDGRYVAFSTGARVLPSSSGLVAYVKDMHTGVTTAASVDSMGQPVEGWSPQLSEDGQLITFRTKTRLLPTDHNHTYDVYLRRWAPVH